MDTYIIMDKEGHFYNGANRFVPEYPDAEVYESYTKAEKDFTKIEEALAFENTDDLMLIENYGFEHERVVLFGGRVDD